MKPAATPRGDPPNCYNCGAHLSRGQGEGIIAWWYPNRPVVAIHRSPRRCQEARDFNAYLYGEAPDA